MSRDPGDIPLPRFASVNIVEALSAAQHMPDEALDLAVRAPGRLAGAVLEVANRAADGTPLSDRETNLLFWGVHVLGAAREPRLHGPLLRLLRRPAAEPGGPLSGAVGTMLPRLVAGSFDDDPSGLEAAVLDRDADEFVRLDLFGAYAFLVADGRIDAAGARALLVRFDTERAARAGDAAWVGWEQAIALLGFADLRPRVDAARADARLLDDLSDPEWFEATMAEAAAHPADPTRFGAIGLGYVEDLMVELEEALAADEDEEAQAPEPVRNPLREIGRNDPCPCGSGKKHKKCCLAA